MELRGFCAFKQIIHFALCSYEVSQFGYIFRLFCFLLLFGSFVNVRKEPSAYAIIYRLRISSRVEKVSFGVK
jgi:hypothetical protein